MIKKLILSVVISMPICVFGAEVAKIQQDAHSVNKTINVWENTFIKPLLSEHFDDNMNLFEFITQMERAQVKSDPEVEAIYETVVSQLMQAQVGLNFFAENIINIANSENIDLDGFLSKRRTLKLEYETNLSQINGVESARMMVNRLLYFSLMDKYTNS